MIRDLCLCPSDPGQCMQLALAESVLRTRVHIDADMSLSCRTDDKKMFTHLRKENDIAVRTKHSASGFGLETLART